MTAVTRLAASAVALSLWLGAALLLAAVVAPAAFAALPSRALAGAVVGRVLPAVFVAGIVAGALVAALELAGTAAPFGRARLVAAAVLAGACGIAQFVVGPRIHRLREAIGPSIEALAADDARRAAFGRLHGISVAWMGAGMLAALVALVLCVLALRARS
jgi:hypothetical protein